MKSIEIETLLVHLSTALDIADQNLLSVVAIHIENARMALVDLGVGIETLAMIAG